MVAKTQTDKLVEEAQAIKETWAPILEGKDEAGEALFAPISDRYRKNVTARLLENTAQFYLNENQTTGIDNVDPVLINLVRRVAPNLMAYDMVGVQPMKGPAGLIFALRSHYGAQPTGPFGTPGDSRDAFQAGAGVNSDGFTPAQQNGIDSKAANEAMYREANTTFSGTGTQTSNLTAPDYNAYTVGKGFETNVGENLGSSAPGSAAWAEMSFTIEKTNVVAVTRGLKAEYTHELSQDLRSVHGLDAETELSNILSTEILAEINREVVNEVRKVAKVGAAERQYVNGVLLQDSNGANILSIAGSYDFEKNSDGRWSNEKHKSLLLKINKEANAIAKDTRRGRGNFIICSSDVAAVLDLTGKMVYSPAIDNNLFADDTGNTFIGILQGRFKVYIDPYLGYDEVIVGYKGPNQMDAGFFYCPYVPLQIAKTIDPNTAQPKIFYKTRYGMVANPFTAPMTVRNGNSYFRKFKVFNL